MGFGKKGKNSFTVHRSEEILPGEMRGGLSRGSSASSDGEGSGGDGDRFERLEFSSFFCYDLEFCFVLISFFFVKTVVHRLYFS